jgi:hypothetical protein
MDPIIVPFVGTKPLMRIRPATMTTDERNGTKSTGNEIIDPLFLTLSDTKSRLGLNTISESNVNDLFLLGQHKTTKQAFFVMNVLNNVSENYLLLIMVI